MTAKSLALCVLLLLPLLGSCITAYKGSKSQIATCEQYENQNAWRIRRQLGDGASLAELNKTAAESYATPVSDSKQVIKPIILRYSEAGNLVSQCDHERVLAALNGVRRDKIVLVFVHGWRSDSGPGSNVTYNYRDAAVPKGTAGNELEAFANLATEVSYRSKRPVIPIYISWKGGPRLGALDVLSFWNRRDAADRISRSGELSRLFGSIESITDHQEARGLDNHVVYMGHSFGSRILFSSIVSELIFRSQLAAPVDSEADGALHNSIKAPADLILLFNPALEAAAYRAIDQYRYSKAAFSNNRLPLMVIMQSESDKAVRVYFPIGQFFWGFLNTTRITGLGFKPEFLTHAMCIKVDGDSCNPGPGNDVLLCPNGGDCPATPYAVIPSSLANLRDTPFRVVRVNEHILDGHVWFNRDGGFRSLLDNDKGQSFNDWLADFLAYDYKRKQEEKLANPQAATLR